MKTNQRMIQRLTLVTVMMMWVGYVKAESYSAGYDRATQTLIFYRSGGYSGAFDAIYDVANSDDINSGLQVDYDVRVAIKKVVFHSSFKTAQFTNIYKWFSNFTVLTSFEGLENFDMTQVTDASYLFEGCRSLKSLDLGQKVMNSLKTAEDMFFGCEELESLTMPTTSKALKNMRFLFSSCKSLQNLDLSRMVTGGVSSMSHCFTSCTSLTRLDLRTFNTSYVTDMSWMFAHCSSLKTLYLYNFDTFRVTDTRLMFSSCENLQSIVVGDNWTMKNVQKDNEMFYNCLSLKGGAGTTYSSSHFNKEYARIDNAPNEPGYLRRLIEYDLWVGGTQITELNQEGIRFGEGYVSYTPIAKSLLLANATINSSGVGIYNGNPNTSSSTSGIDGLIIEIYGNCTIESETSPMILWQNTVIKDYHSDEPGRDKLEISGYNSINFDKRLTFNNSYTFLTIQFGMFRGTSDETALVIGGGNTFCGGSAYGQVVTDVYSMLIGGGSELLSPVEGSTVTFSSSQKTVLLDGQPMKEFLLVGHYYPLWWGDFHLSTALVPYLNKLFALPTFNIEVTETVSSTQYDMKIKLPSTSTQSFRSTAPLLTMELTGDCTFSTTAANTPAMDLGGDTTINGTGKLTVSSENGPAIRSTVNNAKLTIGEVGANEGVSTIDLDVYGKTGGLLGFRTLYFSRVAGTVTCDEGYCVNGGSESGTIYSFSLDRCYITNDVTFDKNYGRINATSLVLARELSTITTEIEQVSSIKSQVSNGDWYTIDGRKLNGKPAKKGIYINNGNRVVIK